MVCPGARHWARRLRAIGHRVRPIAPKFVAPCRTSGKPGKGDAADAAAIREAVQRARQPFVEQRTATAHEPGGSAPRAPQRRPAPPQRPNTRRSRSLPAPTGSARSFFSS